jgi:HEAT repeat protein
MSQLENLLQQCTVKLTLPGRIGWGTGFFVAPEWILTCAHVVQAAKGELVQVRWQKQENWAEAVVERSLPNPYDLALLRVTLPADANPPCVYLDVAIQSRDSLYLFGYPDQDFPNGCPVTFNCEGLTGDEPALIKFALGQVRPGMSGSPLLNQRTGKVCGIVKFTRDRSFDLGGGAIPTRVILEQFPQLREFQKEFHGSDRRWSNVVAKQSDIDFQPYLNAIATTYEKWWQFYTLTDAEGKQRQSQEVAPIFDFGLMVQTVKKEEREQQQEEKVERFSVLEGLRKYADQQVLLVGRPGSGKSTALARLMLEMAAPLAPQLWGEQEGEPSRIAVQSPPELGDLGGKIPVLVELRYWQGSIAQLILNSLTRHGLALTVLPQLLILFDGVNELPSEEARSQLSAFRRNHPKLPMIFTTRDLSLGGDLGIEQKLEMQPLTEAQMQAFIRAYVPEQAEAMLRQLRDRLREFGQTPLLLWMLCQLFQQTGQIPENLGLVFRLFTQGYERKLKQDVVIESDREWWKPALQQLAWVMMQGTQPTELRVAIAREEAVRAIAQFLEGKVPYAENFTRKCLRDLQKHHLIQAGTGSEELEFRHQLIQEYYAAEALLARLPRLSDAVLKREYLNYLKWTEPIALMLALVDDEAQALRVVKLALDVDLILGAKLVGNVQPTFQEQAVSWVIQLTVLPLLKVMLLATTRSQSAVPALLRALKDQSLHIRARAIYALGDVGGEMAMPALYEALEDQDAHVRWMAADALKNIGGEVTIPVLLKALHDQNSFVRWMAADALGKVSDEMIVPHLLKALKDQDSDVRDKVAKALKSINSEVAVSVLLKALEDRNNDVRLTAIEALGKIGSEKAIPALLKTFQNRERDIRLKAVEALEKMGGEGVIPPLLKALKHKDSHVRVRATYALGKVGDEIAVLPLLEALKHRDSRVRARAAYGLGAVNLKAVHGLEPFNENSRIAIHPLLEVLKDRDSNVRSCAAYALGNLSDEGDKVVIPALLKALQDRDSEVRSCAAYALGKVGDERVISDLLKVVEDCELRVRFSALQALGDIGDKAAMPVLLKALEDSDDSIRWFATKALGDMGDEVAIPALLKALKDCDFRVRAGATEALGNMDDEVAIPALLKALETQDPIVCEAASDALARLGSPIPLSQLWQICLTGKVNYLRWIASIQNRCKFYNYEIWQEAIQIAKLERQKGEQDTMVGQATEGIHVTPHYTVNTEIFQVIEHNDGNVIGKQSPERKSTGDRSC